jgi:hypothetical protein
VDCDLTTDILFETSACNSQVMSQGQWKRSTRVRVKVNIEGGPFPDPSIEKETMVAIFTVNLHPDGQGQTMFVFHGKVSVIAAGQYTVQVFAQNNFSLQRVLSLHAPTC